jgi:outer membrane protein assembly factor BamC
MLKSKMSHSVARSFVLTALTSFALVSLSGCSWFGNKGSDYRAQGGRIQPLEVPPDLTQPSFDDRFAIPDGKATTYSAYSRDRGASPSAGGSAPVGIVKVDNARIERAGGQRWLVVKAEPASVWPVVRDFWAEAGYVLKRESADIGIMETDWREDRTRIPQDFIRNTVGRVLDGLWSTGERDKFRTRIEAGAEPGTTDIFISHRGLEEVFTNADKSSSTWQTRATKGDMEAEMLGRLMVKFGITAEAAKATVAAATSPVGGGAAPAAAAAPRAAYDKVAGGNLTMTDAFDRAWRRVGLALDRVGFTVEDRDRSKGLFFVRYIDPEADASSSNKKGFLDSLAFWRKDDPKDRPLYRIFVAEKTGTSAGTSEVQVQGADGKVDNSATAKRILSLLLEQLK